MDNKKWIKKSGNLSQVEVLLHKQKVAVEDRVECFVVEAEANSRQVSQQYDVAHVHAVHLDLNNNTQCQRWVIAVTLGTSICDERTHIDSTQQKTTDAGVWHL